MSYINIEYNSKNGFMVGAYLARFNPNSFGVDESSQSFKTFEGCVGFVLQQYLERIVVPHVSRPEFDLIVGRKVQIHEKKILEEMVKSLNEFATSGLAKKA